MSTNCYHYEESWSFDPKSPTKYFGWGIITSGTQLQIANFNAPGLRDEMAKEVHNVLAKALKPDELANIDEELIAACFLLMTSGSEEDVAVSKDIASEELNELLRNEDEDEPTWEKLAEIGSKYSMM